MFSAKKSILISNVLDPYTKDQEDLKHMYKELFDKNRYQSIETRVIEEEDTIAYFNSIRPQDCSVTFCINGNLARLNVALGSCNEEKRKGAIDYCKNLLEIAKKTNTDYICLASGKAEENPLKNLDMFIKSLSEIFDYTKEHGYKTKVCIEPLDQYSHKKNTVGSLDMTLRMVRRLEELGYGLDNYMIAWDAAHYALNEDDFEETIKQLSKYIYKIHFANAVLDKDDPQYGDYHLGFDVGFMNMDVAKQIYGYAKKYIDHQVEFAVEVKENDKDHAWTTEEETYKFLSEALKD